jgi:hypothetical protein
MRQASADCIADIFGMEHEIVGTTRLRGRGHCIDNLFYWDGDRIHGDRFINSKNAKEVYHFLRGNNRGILANRKFHTHDEIGQTSDKMYVVMAYQNDPNFSGYAHWLIYGQSDSYVEAYRIARNAKRSGLRMRLHRGTELTYTPR